MARRNGALGPDVMSHPHVVEAIERKVIQVLDGDRIKYNLKQAREYDLADPEEQYRAFTIAWLVTVKGYPANRMKTEVQVPRRTPNDFADIVLYSDDRCVTPYLVVENKDAGQSERARRQWIEQGFGNANSLRAPFMLYDEGDHSMLFNVAEYPPMEREQNRLGGRDVLPTLYGEAPEYTYIAGAEDDIGPVASPQLESAVRRAHSIIWSGGKRDPLNAFDEWSKILFARVVDERTTPNGTARPFQVGTHETDTIVANRIHELFRAGKRTDPSIFGADVRITLPDNKVAAVVRVLQGISFDRTDADTIGAAFEHFFGSVFRGQLGQYFTRRELARFTVAMLRPTHRDFVIDPTAGSGGFLLEVLLQVWHQIEHQFAGRPQLERNKTDFALQHVYGIEIHEVLARICKINLLLHHDGHTNIEADRTCLDSVFTRPRLNPPSEQFSMIVGNPPFGDEVEEGDEDHLGENQLATFTIAAGRDRVDSEHVILERSIQLLEAGGKLGLVIPDGLLNNQGYQSNCPQSRMMLARSGKVLAVVSLPDYAFRKSGAQNKTSILFFQKFTRQEKRQFERRLQQAITDQELDDGEQPDMEAAIGEAWEDMNHITFLAEADTVGYTPSGSVWPHNDLYRADNAGHLLDDQQNTILGEFRRFEADPYAYTPRRAPDCMIIPFHDLWNEHDSHRLDPKYHLFKRQERMHVPEGWMTLPISQIMRRRDTEATPEEHPEQHVVVMTISNKGEIRPRAAGKGKAPPEWLGMYFEDSSSRWFAASTDDVVYSSIDLWKGCIALVPETFNGALVTNEFPIYEVTDPRVNPAFLQCLLRTRYYQRAFRAITTGHSNRRRTQQDDFEELEISFPLDPAEQTRLAAPIAGARQGIREAEEAMRRAQAELDRIIDGAAAGAVVPEGALDAEDEEPDEA